MWDIILEILTFLGIRVFKKKKKKDTELASPETGVSNQGNEHPGRKEENSASVCSGCGRTVQEARIFESGQVWCLECYKRHVLKVPD